MVDVADPDGGRAHDAYHRLLREGKWDMAQLWRRLAPLLVSHLEGNLRLVVDLDDTLFHKAGRKVNGVGSFRDPIRSRGQRTAFAHGLNLVVLTLRIRPPWGGEPLCLPINMCRYSKRDGRSLLDLVDMANRYHICSLIELAPVWRFSRSTTCAPSCSKLPRRPT